LRLYPPQPAFVRRAVKETQIGDYVIPEGVGFTITYLQLTLSLKTEVSVVPYLLHRDPTHWENPEQFDPFRFSKEREAINKTNGKKRHTFDYIPFR
jgi:cytochrome P450